MSITANNHIRIHSAKNSWRRWVAYALLLVTCKPSFADDPFFAFSDEQLTILQQNLATAYVGNQLMEDPVVNGYLNKMAARLNPEKRIFVAATRNKAANAFANWGNVVFINAGMISFANDEVGLAGVLAHEIAHVKLQHFTRISEKVNPFQALTLGTILAAIITKNAEITDAGIAISALTKNKEYEVRRRYEREADQAAARYLVEADLPLDGYIELITRLSPERALPEYAVTHPFGSERVSLLFNMQRSLPQVQEKTIGNELDFWLVQERVRHLINSSSSSDAPTHLQPVVKAFRNLLQGDIQPKGGKLLLNEHKNHWIVAMALADHELLNSNMKQAVEILDEALAISPKNQILQLRKLELYVLDDDYEAAKFSLTSMSPKLRNSLKVAEIERRLWKETGNDFRYRLAVAHYHYFSGQIGNAKHQISLARKLDASREKTADAGRLLLLENNIRKIEKLL